MDALIAADEAVIRECDTFIAIGSKLAGHPADAKSTSAPLPIGQQDQSASTSKKSRIIEVAERLIRARGPATARQILDLIDAEGNADLVGGQSERGRISNLASILSRQKDVFASSAHGYVLVTRTSDSEGLTPVGGVRQEGLAGLQ